MNQIRKYLDQTQVPGQTDGPDWGIQVLDAGCGRHPANQVYPAGGHPAGYLFNWDDGRILQEFQLVYIAGGGGEFESAQLGPVAVQAGTVFLLFPGVWHRFRPDQATGWEEYWVGFKGIYAEHLMQQDCFRQEAPLIDIGFSAVCLDVFSQLIQTLESAHPAAAQLASCLTIQLLGLVYAAALLKQKALGRKETIINNIRYQLHERWAEPVSFQILATQHHVSYAWLRKAFKEVTGSSPGQYHLRLRLEKAGRLLAETSLTIAEIAFQTGFPGEGHFGVMFKKKNGLSPGEYRKYQKT